jgi:hypothetical protein
MPEKFKKTISAYPQISSYQKRNILDFVFIGFYFWYVIIYLNTYIESSVILRFACFYSDFIIFSNGVSLFPFLFPPPSLLALTYSIFLILQDNVILSYFNSPVLFVNNAKFVMAILLFCFQTARHVRTIMDTKY